MSDLHLLNGTPAPRVRSSEDCTVLECQCAHTDSKWLRMCAAHWAEWSDRHEAARKPAAQEAAS